jgi:WD40 repeat protein
MQKRLREEALKANQKYNGKNVVHDTTNNSIRDSDCDSDSDSGSDDGNLDVSVQISKPSSKPILPIKDHAILSGHRRAIIALSIHPTGTRLLSGALDHELHWYDYHGMNSSMSPFRNVIPLDGYSPTSIEWRSIGDHALVCCDNTSVLVMDREGNEIGRTVRGDMYIVDARRTKGHTSATNIALWHPLLREKFISAGTDATIRLWDVNDLNACKAVLKPRGIQRSTLITAMSINSDGTQGIFGMNDGSLRICTLGRDGNSITEGSMVASAHEPSTFTSSIVIAKDNRSIITRGGDNDNTVKIWDIRLFRTPVTVLKDVISSSEHMNIVLSPDETILCVGVAGKTSLDFGRLSFYSRKNWSLIQEYSLENSKETAVNATTVDEPASLATTPWVAATNIKTTPIRLCWPDKLNQIVVGCSDGSILQYYDRALSQRGVLLCVDRKQSVQVGGILTSGIGEIITPAAMSYGKRQKIGHDAPTTAPSGKWEAQAKHNNPKTMTAHLLGNLIHQKQIVGQNDKNIEDGDDVE